MEDGWRKLYGSGLQNIVTSDNLLLAGLSQEFGRMLDEGLFSLCHSSYCFFIFSGVLDEGVLPKYWLFSQFSYHQFCFSSDLNTFSKKMPGITCG